MKKEILLLLGFIVVVVGVRFGQVSANDSKATPTVAVEETLDIGPTPTEAQVIKSKAMDTQQLALQKCENDCQQKVIDQKLVSFDKRTDDLKWLITTSLTLGISTVCADTFL